MTTATNENGVALERRGVRIVDTFAEAFDMRASRVIVTAKTPEWARTAVGSPLGASAVATDRGAGPADGADQDPVLAAVDRALVRVRLAPPRTPPLESPVGSAQMSGSRFAIRGSCS